MSDILLNAHLFRKGVSAYTLMVLTSCTMFFVPPRPPELVMDKVCRKKVDKAEAYKVKYMGNVYYFDQYACREKFKMNPENFY